MIHCPLEWRVVIALGVVGLCFLLRPVSRLIARWRYSRELTHAERADAERLYPLAHKLTAGESCTPTAPSSTVHHDKARP